MKKTSLDESKAYIDLKGFIDQMKEIYDLFLIYIDDSSLDSDEYFSNLLRFFDTHNIQQNEEMFNHFIEILINIANNHYRKAGFFQKIERLLIKYQSTIQKTYNNQEIYEKFESNKRLLYFLINEKILTIDNNIEEIIKNKIDLNGKKYSKFFITEIQKSDTNEKFLQKHSGNLNKYNKQRQEGENESYICSLIRSDSIENFISHVNQENLSLFSKIKSSVFETNSFLLDKNPTLIEYASFFGSIRIINYLMKNNVELTKSLWIYSIHSNNAELIQLLEDNKILPEDGTYEEALNECIKCHHNDIGNYIQDNLINKEKMKSRFRFNNQKSFEEQLFDSALKYHNFSFFPTSYDNFYEFYYSYKYNYNTIALFLIHSYTSKEMLNEIDNTNIYDFTIKNVYSLLSKEKEINKYFFRGNKRLSRIAIPSTIKTINIKSFLNCTSLIEIAIPSSVTSIGDRTFHHCISLREITILSSVTSIGNLAFNKCTSLEHIKISSSVINIGYCAFR